MKFRLRIIGKKSVYGSIEYVRSLGYVEGTEFISPQNSQIYTVREKLNESEIKGKQASVYYTDLKYNGGTTAILVGVYENNQYEYIYIGNMWAKII